MTPTRVPLCPDMIALNPARREGMLDDGTIVKISLLADEWGDDVGDDVGRAVFFYAELPEIGYWGGEIADFIERTLH